MSTPTLDAAELLAAAQAETGLSDWGDDTLPERFATAVDLIRSVGMDGAGERRAAETCMWLLTDRLRFFDDHQRYALDDEVVDRPLFVTGEPRSGTTLLHALLSVDPDARALRFWEVMHPSPPPGPAAADDPRRAQADEEWHEINAQLPEWLVLHPYNDMLGDGLPECERTWAFDFRVFTPTAWWRVPMGMVIGGLPSDLASQYHIHKMMLQAIQHTRPERRWVLKGFHGMRLEALFDAYPDATLLYIHRDPVQVTASRIQMAVTLHEGLTGRADPEAVAEQARVHLAASRAGFHSILENPLVDDPRIMHVRYKDFMADQVATIRGYYEFADFEWTDEGEAAMRHYLATNKGDRYGKFRYTTDVIGVDVDALHEEFAPYRERFDIDIEQRR
ncbi:MAG TPA: sulfotransferase [Acidimicrobiales bacterium]